MADTVNTQRAYRSPGREEQARRTRRAIVDAAHRLFMDDGYTATTVPRVAAAAGVSVPTVYKAFGNKPTLAKAVFDRAIAGDDEAVPLVDRDRLRAVRDEPDAQRKLRLYGAFLAQTLPRHVPVQLVVREAAATNPEAARVWEDLQAERLRGMSRFAADLARDGHLRRGVSRAAARDILWTYSSAECFELLVLGRGWPAKRYGAWAGDALVAALL